MTAITERPGDTPNFDSFAPFGQSAQEIAAFAAPVSRQPWEIIPANAFDIPVGGERYNQTTPYYYNAGTADSTEGTPYVAFDTSKLPGGVQDVVAKLERDFGRRRKEAAAAAATNADPAFREEVAGLIGYSSAAEQGHKRGRAMLAGVGRLFARLGRGQEEAPQPLSSSDRIRAKMATTLQEVLDRGHPFGRHEAAKLPRTERMLRTARKIAGMIFERESPQPVRPTIQPHQVTAADRGSHIGDRHHRTS